MPLGHSGPADLWSDLFGDLGADGDAPRELLVGALIALPEPQFPDRSLQRVCRALRGVVRWGEPPCDLLLAASGLEAALLPSDDIDMWLALAAGTISPRGALPSGGEAWRDLDEADWLGAILYMARSGPGAPTTPHDLLVGIASGPETRGEIDALHAKGITRAFEGLGPLWRALGAVGSAQDGRPLTPLGHWGFPLALLRAWDGR
jgi:hypothetical protein